MYRFFPLAVALMFVAFVAGCGDRPAAEGGETDATPMSEMSDKEMVLEALAVNSESFHDMIEGLTPEQLAFQESPDRWSIAGIAEHIVITETFFESTIQEVLASEPMVHAADSGATDEQIVAAMADRTQKFQAPDIAQPTGKYTTADEILADFDARRAMTVEMVNNADVDLRSVGSEHPALGMLDGAQWVLFVASHADRHLDQMQQVKDHADYPQPAM